MKVDKEEFLVYGKFNNNFGLCKLAAVVVAALFLETAAVQQKGSTGSAPAGPHNKDVNHMTAQHGERSGV